MRVPLASARLSACAWISSADMLARLVPLAPLAATDWIDIEGGAIHQTAHIQLNAQKLVRVLEHSPTRRKTPERFPLNGLFPGALHFTRKRTPPFFGSEPPETNSSGSKLCSRSSWLKSRISASCPGRPLRAGAAPAGPGWPAPRSAASPQCQRPIQTHRARPCAGPAASIEFPYPAPKPRLRSERKLLPRSYLVSWFSH